jgi:hypothetical protein
LEAAAVAVSKDIIDAMESKSSRSSWSPQIPCEKGSCG